jgi:hypothetical protein
MTSFSNARSMMEYSLWTAVTAMSPSQFQKQLRLQEARRLMLSEDLDTASAAYRVGYQDASHFNREYKSQIARPTHARCATAAGRGAGSRFPMSKTRCLMRSRAIRSDEASDCSGYLWRVAAPVLSPKLAKSRLPSALVSILRARSHSLVAIAGSLRLYLYL